MNEKNKIAFLGGDARQYIAARELTRCGYECCIWGCREQGIDGVPDAESIYEAMRNAVAIVLPLPTSPDGVCLNCQPDESGEVPRLDNILDCILKNEKPAVIGGKLPLSFVAAANKKGMLCFDYFESEVFQIKNAYITAEAALSIAMENTNKTVRDSRFAVTGYGRISKQLVSLLRALGARVTVLARKESALALAELEGCGTASLSGDHGEALRELESGYDVIFNTVPSLIFGREFFERVDSDTLIVELASAPGGIDIQEARSSGKRVLWALALPGKYAPGSAGAIISECVYKYLGEVRGE